LAKCMRKRHFERDNLSERWMNGQVARAVMPYMHATTANNSEKPANIKAYMLSTVIHLCVRTAR
jgi:hypothetical protein